MASGGPNVGLRSMKEGFAIMAQEMPGRQPTEKPPADWREKVGEAARDLNTRARELIEEGNQRRLVVEHGGRSVVSVPLTLAAVVGAVAVLFAPLLTVLGTVAALMARVHARVERRE